MFDIERWRQPFTIKCEYKGNPKDKEEDIRRLKQELEDRFNCQVRDYKPIDEKETDFYQEFQQRYGYSILEYLFRVGRADYKEEETVHNGKQQKRN